MNYIDNRPVYNKFSQRSNMEWGEAPNYNKEYRKIRWSSNNRHQKPSWLHELQFNMRLKSTGLWNGGRHFYKKANTKKALKGDIRWCINNNIPFKTKTFEYKPSDQWLYVKGEKVLKYDLCTGSFSGFTYSGVYDKVTTMTLRMLGFDITVINRKLIWTTNKFGDTLIDVNKFYAFNDDIVRETNSIVNIDLYLEYKNGVAPGIGTRLRL